jgi:hypothetical protein
MGFYYFSAMVDVHIHSQTSFSYLGMMTMLNHNSLVFSNNFPYCHTSYVQSKKLELRYMSKETGQDEVMQCIFINLRDQSGDWEVGDVKGEEGDNNDNPLTVPL